MPFPSRAALAFLLAAAIPSTAATAAEGSGAAPVTVSACASRDACIGAIMEAVRAGREIEGFAHVTRLKQLSGTVAGQVGSYAPIRAQHGLALSQLQAGRPADAERELKKTIASVPTAAPVWMDLATAFGKQGKIADTAAALAVAHFWAARPDDLLRLFEHGAGGPNGTIPAAALHQALAIITANAQAKASFDASLPPLETGKLAGDGVASPTLAVMDIRRCMPNYPEFSIENEHTGNVVLAFYVGADGKPLRIRRLQSSGHVELDNATLAALGPCGFRPAMLGGLPVPAWARIEYRWSME